MDDLSYWLALHKAPGIGPATFSQLFEHFQKPETLFNSPEALNTLNLAPARRLAVQKAIQEPDWSMVEQELEWSEAPENHILLLTQTEYPELLKQIHAPPPLLFVKGQLSVLSDIQLAMVGSRNPSVDGHETAWQFAHHLAQSGMVITSGMALGIDAQSHYGALEAKGKSIAVAGTGLDRIYPARHKKLAWQLVEQGAIISEYALGTGPMKHNFPQRNRIISGLSVGTLVVEAALKSGSLITAQTALEQAREVFAIPGSIYNPLTRGCHQLIKSGAKLIENADDILEELSNLMFASQLGSMNNQSTTPSPDTVQNSHSLLPKIQQQILKQIGFNPVSIDTIINRSGLSNAEINANLVLLEVDDYIQSHSGGLVSLKTT
ncbi:MAG: DNA-processing protein DprA [gamma proteobacterium symbiont of Bathyaustriella thionipta]|nr:DNA-processing protein DprA [gamma proteobacterium symbiont of Bathyaustriella thionipta]MCU7948748.1 DNA-processing protein DprA [gamma proteobacterium symbiont of Bathyaustriella thionipta]MCU7953556.1 DNA-processing protein DprA [gamma proteobacterium symbiont of Bathyaustriella thionipta]MCU7955231.1 DNA-processing protein DprA [gamma proteobacterium symbiont of Bathyaustriella thionipta]MCU7967033.1 DNA-processing protein DprA [gamma proteobacterium symbiont of Bathyaustriella thionipta